MDYLEWFPERLAQLRIQKGVSARDMSLSLGQSESYINKIENRRTMPSMSGFLYICEYLDVLPGDFFRSHIFLRSCSRRSRSCLPGRRSIYWRSSGILWKNRTFPGG